MSYEGMTSDGANTIKVWFVNSSGDGYSDELALAAGTNIQQLFDQMVPGGETPHGYVTVIRRGTQIFGGSASSEDEKFPVPGDFALQEGDRVSITPKNQKAA